MCMYMCVCARVCVHMAMLGTVLHLVKHRPNCLMELGTMTMMMMMDHHHRGLLSKIEEVSARDERGEDGFVFRRIEGEEMRARGA